LAPWMFQSCFFLELRIPFVHYIDTTITDVYIDTVRGPRSDDVGLRKKHSASDFVSPFLMKGRNLIASHR
jgi:hypothetical protein